MSQQAGLVGTALGEVPLETHSLGLGNLARYVAEVQPPRSGIVVEKYAVVVPSSLEPGEYDLVVGVVDVRAPASGQPGFIDCVTLTQIQVGE